MSSPDEAEKPGSPNSGQDPQHDDEKQPVETSTTSPSTKPQKKLGFLSRAWKYTGLDKITILLMLKGALPPIIAIAAYESDAWAKKYSTLGYLAAIMSLLSFCIMPRAKFMQTMTLNILFICVSAAVAMLQMACVVTARQNTTRPSTSAGSIVGSSGSTESLAYNSAASVTAAVWFFFFIYVANTVRAKRPQLQFPCILFSIFTVVASTFGPDFPNMTAAMSFVSRLLQTFLTGFGIATGVSFFIIPMTSRGIVSKQTGGFLHLLSVTLKAQEKYLSSISAHREDNLSAQSEQASAPEAASDQKPGHPHHHLWGTHKKTKKSQSELSAEAAALKKTLLAVGALFGKINVEIGFAKKEIAYGKLGPRDYNDLLKLLRFILMPIVGVSTFIDIMNTVKERKATERATVGSEKTLQALRQLELEEWEELVRVSHGAYQRLNEAMQNGLRHISIALEFVEKPKKSATDEENQSSVPAPGDSKFAASFADEIKTFYEHRHDIMQQWCERKGIHLPASFWEDSSKVRPVDEFIDLQATATMRQKENKQQLYLILYIEYLTWSTSKAIQNLVLFADAKIADGTMKKKRIIIPGWRRIKKWVTSAFSQEDTEDIMDNPDSATVWVGDGLKVKKDPEHLPPENIFEKVTDLIRVVPGFLRSPESAFGFRAAVATISIGIMAFIHQTSTFFVKERVLWALIMIAISMSAHAGQGIFNFVCRIFGTVVAMVSSLLVWYIADEKTAAIISLQYIYLCLGMWFFLKNPQFAVVGILSMVTSILIIGYELQARKIGVKNTEASGQPFYPIYILAPYRLVTVISGLFVAFCWTYFPYPVTTHSTLRKDLGASLYLLANYYSCVHTTVSMRLRLGSLYDDEKKGSPYQKLAKARHKVFSKNFLLINKLRESANFIRFEPTFGGKFPKEKYEDILQHLQNVFNYMNLIAYSSRTFSTDPSAEESHWLRDFRKLAAGMNLTSHDLTSTLCLLSASVGNGQPLAPYLKNPKPYQLADQMEAFDPEILSVRHVSEPCYAAFAVLQIASSLLSEEMGYIVKDIQDLVGEVDFSFHIISTSGDDDSSTEGSASTLWKEDSETGSKGKKD